MTEDLIKLITSTNGTLEGWATVEKALAMGELIEVERPRLVVELGVFGGRSLIPQAMSLRANKQGVIVGVDPWRVDPVLEGELSPEDKEWWTKNVSLLEIQAKFMDAVWGLGLERWIIPMQCTAETAAGMFRKGSIDILHIDGNHTEVSSTRDVSLYLPRVCPGGFVWFDDTDWPTTKKAVGMLDGGCERVKAVGSCVLFRKRGG